MTRARALLAVGILALTACGDGGDTAATSLAATSTTGSPSATTTAPAVSPTALGDEIGALYTAAYDDLIALLADRPAAADAVADVTALKESYIGQMVALGSRREALGASERAVVDARITAALTALPAATYEAYQQVYADYSADLDMANLIASFNILGQYANFDLLRQQAPEEAARLGLD